MPTDGETPIPVSPGSSAQNSERRPPVASSSWVVQRWPEGGTHWRSSAQITQDAGGFWESG